MKRVINILTIIFVQLVLLGTVTMAFTLKLNVTSNKENLNVGEEVVITIDWKDGMQAADFILNYDSKRFEFVSIDIDDIFYKVEDSKVKIAWVSLDDIDKTSINIIFKALKPGKANFSTEISGGFATGKLVLPDNYDTGSTTVKVNRLTMEYILPIIVIVVVFIIIVLIVIKKTKIFKK